MAEPNPALVAFNENNKIFWARQKALMDLRMADRAVLETAIEAIAFEAKRGISVPRQMSFEKALEDAAKAQLRFLRQLARSAGKARKTDSLQSTIIGIVGQNPEVSLRGLLKELRYRRGKGIIDEIDETRIYFIPNDAAPLRRNSATTISVPISGLKHRLTRAREVIREENRSRQPARETALP